MGSVSKSYKSEDFLLIYQEIRKYLSIYEEAVSHMNLIIYEENLVFFFVSALYHESRYVWMYKCSNTVLELILYCIENKLWTLNLLQKKFPVVPVFVRLFLHI